MRILFYLLFTARLFAQQDPAIEKAVLAANAQVTQAAESRDLDALFRFMLDTDKGSIVLNGGLSLTPQQAKDRLAPSFRAPVKVAYRWKQQHVTVLSPTTALLVSEGESVVTAATRIESPFRSCRRLSGYSATAPGRFSTRTNPRRRANQVRLSSTTRRRAASHRRSSRSRRATAA